MSDFKAEVHQNQFQLGALPQTSLGNLQRLPKPPYWLKEDLLKGRGRCWKREEREREVSELEGTPVYIFKSFRIVYNMYSSISLFQVVSNQLTGNTSL